MNRRTLLKALGGTAVASFVSLSRTSSAADGGRELKIAVQDLKNTLEPLREPALSAERIYFNIFDSLLDYDPTSGKLRPSLANAWRRVDDRTLEVDLRRDVQFHSGQELTADDVVFSFGAERMFNSKNAGYGTGISNFGGLASVQVVGPNTVRFVTKDPDPILEHRLAGQASQIISAKDYLGAGSYDAWSTKVIGTGPYKLDLLKAGEFVRLSAHGQYWGGVPSYNSLTFRLARDTSARIAGLLAKEYDIITDVPPDQIATISKNPGFEVLGGPVNNIRMVMFDPSDPILNDRHLRLALCSAIDYQTIVSQLWNNKTTTTDGFQFKEFGELFVSDAGAPKFDLDKAKQLLSKSKYHGEELTYRIMPDYYPLQIATAEVLQQMWAAAGINVKVEVNETWALVQRQPGRQIFDLSSTMWYPDPVGYLVQIWGERGPIQKTWTGWKNDEFNRLGRIVETSLNVSERKAAVAGMLKIMTEEDPTAAPLHFLAQFYGASNGVQWRPNRRTWMDFKPVRSA
ncbi:ABC transporter substrate-binding protein [Ensifer aridi]|uniref:ABC transporter substrate-binding protein n=1 Tax=Ensifer aridi TaxID=1708715 RepID=UPI000614F50E|nr:ABC transporter substrate-binding protein [Ensifer aridi]